MLAGLTQNKIDHVGASFVHVQLNGPCQDVLLGEVGVDVEAIAVDYAGELLKPTKIFSESGWVFI